MFGYVTPDKPNMFIKDFTLFRAYYCGLCICMGKEAGQFARLTVNYDMTVVSAFFHDLLEEERTVELTRCIGNPRKRPIVQPTPLMHELCRFNLILAGLKIADDMADGDSCFFKRLAFSSSVKKAREKSPELASLADRCLERQLEEEKKEGGLDAAAEPFADMMRGVFRTLAKDKNTPAVEQLGYLLGKYVYFIDALDDYDEDVKKGRFNPFKRAFGAASFKELRDQKREDLEFIMEDIVKGVEEAYRDIKMGANEGIITNVFWYGLRRRIAMVLNKEDSKCTKIRL